MKSFLIRLIINSVAVYAAIAIMDGQGLTATTGVWYSYVVVGFIFGVVNALLRPLIKLLTCPLIVLTLGLFTLLINTGMFYLTGWLGTVITGFGFTVDTFWGAFFGALITSIVSVVLSIFLDDDKKKKKHRKTE
ncbi:MAG: phage holin family protein [Anaerolineae bacterium]|jgi:putative membrane protein|nr:phage holin family protein [Anaerolineae bacterium]